MRPHVVRQEAHLRLRNTESLRSIAFRRIARAVKEGRLTDAEARQLRTDFWEDRMRDMQIAKVRR